MGLGANGPSSSPRAHKELGAAPACEEETSVDGIVTDYLAIANDEFAMDDVSDAYKIVKKKRLKRHEEVKVELSHCRYEILRTVVSKLGWQEASHDSRTWNLYWTDTSIGAERLMTLRRGQKVNHFFGMLQICRKKSLARHLATMRKMFPAEYRFFPRAFILPNQLQEFLTRFNAPKCRTYILKPDSGSQGKGVALVQNISDVKQAISGFSGANMLAQKYLTNPMLINGYKFDLRIYTLIISCDPLRLYLHREGLVRFCTLKYMKPTRENLRHSCMHLTNYSLNKSNPNFVHNDTDTDKGSKWSLTGLYRALAARGHDTRTLKMQIKKMVVMTFLAITPYLAHNYKTCMKEGEDDNGRSCFEILGMDVLIDEKCKPWLLEVNHSPSFSIDTVLDRNVKEALLSDTLRLINMDPSGLSKVSMADRKNAKLRLYGKDPKKDAEQAVAEELKPKLPTKEMEEYEEENMGNFDRIYPVDDASLQSLYDVCLTGAEEAFKQSFDMKVKKAISKAQEERKQEALEKELEEKRRLRIRAQMRKRAQENAKLVALSRQTEESEDGVAIPKIVRERETTTLSQCVIDSVDLRLLHQKRWNESSSPEKQAPTSRRLSPRCLSLLQPSPTRSLAWELTLRNHPIQSSLRTSNSPGFCKPSHTGLLPPIKQQVPVEFQSQQQGSYSSPRKHVAVDNYGCSSDASTRMMAEQQKSRTSPTTLTAAAKRGSTGVDRFPDVVGRGRRSYSPDGCLPTLRTLPTARLIFEEPVVNTTRTEPTLKLGHCDSGGGAARWQSMQMNDVVKVLKGSKGEPGINPLHICRICRTSKRIPRYDAGSTRASRRRLRRGLGLAAMTPTPEQLERLLPPKDRVVNAFVTHADPNRFLAPEKCGLC